LTYVEATNIIRLERHLSLGFTTTAGA